MTPSDIRIMQFKEICRQLLLIGLGAMVITSVGVAFVFHLSVVVALRIGASFSLFVLVGVIWSNFLYRERIACEQRFSIGLLLSFLIIPPMAMITLKLGYPVNQNLIFTICWVMLLLGIGFRLLYIQDEKTESKE